MNMKGTPIFPWLLGVAWAMVHVPFLSMLYHVIGAWYINTINTAIPLFGICFL
jgi:hypothetical protein